VTVGASSQKAGQRQAHHWCCCTRVRPHPSQGLLASAFGQRLVAVEGGDPPPAINSINREDPGWSTSPLSHIFLLFPSSLSCSTLLHSLLHKLGARKFYKNPLAHFPLQAKTLYTCASSSTMTRIFGLRRSRTNTGNIHQPLQGTSTRYMEERRRSHTTTPLTRLTPPSSTWRASRRCRHTTSLRNASSSNRRHSTPHSCTK